MSRLRKAFISIALVALLIGGSVAVIPPLIWGDHVDYSHVQSIADTHEYQNPTLLAKAWTLPVASLYRSRFEYQRNASFCGPTSLVNVLLSRGESGNQDSILQDSGITTIMGFIPGGVTLGQLASLARQQPGSGVTILRNLDLARFREHLRRANDPSRRYLINFARGPLFAIGSGHFSPVGGYLVEDDLVLVLDVNESYGPWLVRSERLFDAMNTLDTGAEAMRGMLLIE